MPDEMMLPPAGGLSRRGLMARAGLMGAAAALGGGLLDVGSSRRGVAEGSQNLRATFGPNASEKKFAVNDIDILTFALNTEYFEAEFYLRAVNGTGLPASLTTGGQGYGPSPYKAVTPGSVSTFISGTQTTNSDAPNTPVPFTDNVIKYFAQEIAEDEAEHVTFLRTTLGKKTPARPASDYALSFTLAMRAAGVIGPAEIFDPFATQNNFLLAAFFINDIGPTAYIGASPYLANPAYVAASAGLLGVEAYHAGTTRSLVYSLGQDDDALLVQANAIATLRNNTAALSGSPVPNDQGIELVPGQSNVTDTDANAIAFGRGFPAILSLFYLNSTVTMSPTPSGFTPAGFNGRIR